MRAAKVDDNHAEIRELYRSVGATVHDLGSEGDGCPDLLVGFCGRNYLVEVKDGQKPPSARKLTPKQQIWHSEWKGQKAVVETKQQALAVIGARMQ